MTAVATLRARSEWKFFGALRNADRPLALAWWTLLLLRGALPALFAIVIAVLVGAVQHAQPLTVPLAGTGVIFVLLRYSVQCIARLGPTLAIAQRHGCMTVSLWRVSGR